MATLVLAPIAGVMWLTSRSVREARRANGARAAASATTSAPAPEPGAEADAPVSDASLREAVASLVETCRYAKAKGTRVLFSWSV